MNANEIGTKLVELFKENQHEAIYRDLYSPNIVSTEASGETYSGMEAIQGKNEWWEANFETHSAQAEGPFPHGDGAFGVIFNMDVTDKNANQRFEMRELAIYDVEDGRIVRERFFYRSGECD